jgi:hypothetical protein
MQKKLHKMLYLKVNYGDYIDLKAFFKSFIYLDYLSIFVVLKLD